MQYAHSVSGHHMIPFSPEGVPLQSPRGRVLIALGSAGAILTLILTVIAIAYAP
jgi:hypothetical protein